MQVYNQRYIGQDKHIDPQVKLPPSQQQRLIQISGHNIRFRLFLVVYLLSPPTDLYVQAKQACLAHACRQESKPWMCSAHANMQCLTCPDLTQFVQQEDASPLCSTTGLHDPCDTCQKCCRYWHHVTQFKIAQFVARIQLALSRHEIR